MSQVQIKFCAKSSFFYEDFAIGGINPHDNYRSKYHEPLEAGLGRSQATHKTAVGDQRFDHGRQKNVHFARDIPNFCYKEDKRV